MKWDGNNPLTYNTLRNRVLDRNILTKKGALCVGAGEKADGINQVVAVEIPEGLEEGACLAVNKTESSGLKFTRPFVILDDFPSDVNELDENTLYFVMGSYNPTEDEIYTSKG